MTTPRLLEMTDPAVIVASSNSGLRKQIVQDFRLSRIIAAEAFGGADALGKLESSECQLLLLDCRLPDLNAEELLQIIHQRFPGIDVLLLDENGRPTLPSRWRSDNAFHLFETINHWQAPRAAALVKSSSATVEVLPGMVGSAPCMAELYRMVRLVAPRSTPVLISGPTGAGKEVVAMAVHRLSPRNTKPLVVINCAAIPEALLESELFGYVRGAFTGAVQSRLGRIHSAHGGTLFLDEIGELPLGIQAKLLRFLDQGEVQRLGSSDIFRVDVRIVAATNNAATQLTSVSSGINSGVQQQVEQVNQISQQIAAINVKLAAVSSTGQEFSSFLDQRSALIQQLSGIVDVSQINDGTSLTLTTKQGAALVVDGQAYGLTTATASDGTQHIYSEQGADITGDLSGGQMGGMLQARDQTIPSLQSQLDALAGGLVTALNNANAMGTDLNGNPGGNIFTPITGAGSAASMAVAITDPKLLAAGSDGSSGSNGNIANLSAVANQAVSGGLTPIGAYGNVVFQTGMAISSGTTELDASNSMLQQLQQQQSSVSGVSLDEEASNMLLYQRAYQAAAEAVTAVDQMMQTAINMGTTT